MKIISLNAWCGRAGEPLHDFFIKHKNIDIFCLQEVDLDGTKFGPEVTGNNDSNTGIGHKALYNIRTGGKNTATGSGALFNLTSGGYNSGFGELVLSSLTTGNNNVGLGKDFTIFATTDGVVEFRKSKNDKTFVSINPVVTAG